MTPIYLDNAATSFPKPAVVYDAVDRYQRKLGAPVGRSGYRRATEVARQVSEARLGIAQLLGDHDAARVCFTSGGTESLNLAIHGVLRPGDHVVATDAEHNSVLRPLRWLSTKMGVRVTYVGCDARGRVNPQAILKAVEADTRLAAVTHASNVTGAVNDVGAIGEGLRGRETLLLVDAAQTLGSTPLDARGLGIDLVAAPAHKSLLGPLGLGVLYLSERAAEQVAPLVQGGTGSDSESEEQPRRLPDRLESGNLNAPAIVGLAAALAWRRESGSAAALQEAHDLAERLADGLSEIPGVRVISGLPGDSTAVVSMQMEDVDSSTIGAILDSEYGISVRTGYLCAARIHSVLGTTDGGVVRFSLGPFNCADEIERAIGAVGEIADGMR